MVTFAKAQVASFMASLVDYLVTILCVEAFGFWYYIGTGTGTAAGGLVHFSLSRRWVFKSTERARRIQMLHYALVWMGYLLLMTNGVFLFTHYLGFNYLVSKLIVSLALALFYNYPIQRSFVFAKTKKL